MELNSTVAAVGEPIRQYVRSLGVMFRALAGSCSDVWVAPLGQGWNNRLYEIRTISGEYVLKVYPAGREERMRREYAALRALESVGSIPRACLSDAAAAFIDAPVLIYQKVPGRPIHGEELTEQDLDQLAEVWQRVHRLEPVRDTLLQTAVGPWEPAECLAYIERDLKTLSAYPVEGDPRLSDAVKQLRGLMRYAGLMDLKRSLWREPRLRLCQGDHRLANVIKDETGKLWLVDWEHAGIMDPAYEVAGFLWHPETSALTPSHRSQFIRAYCERSDNPFCYEQVSIYLSLLPLQWVSRLLILIVSGGAQPVQPWVTPLPVERLWLDLHRYLHAAATEPGVSLLR